MQTTLNMTYSELPSSNKFLTIIKNIIHFLFILKLGTYEQPYSNKSLCAANISQQNTLL